MEMQRILVTDEQEPRSSADTPWWIRAADRYGVVTLIACFLIWALVQLAMGNIQKIPGLEAQVTAQTEAQKTHDTDTKQALQAIKRLLGGICLNAAKTPEQQRRCIE